MKGERQECSEKSDALSLPDVITALGDEGWPQYMAPKRMYNHLLHFGLDEKAIAEFTEFERDPGSVMWRLPAKYSQITFVRELSPDENVENDKKLFKVDVNDRLLNPNDRAQNVARTLIEVCEKGKESMGVGRSLLRKVKRKVKKRVN